MQPEGYVSDTESDTGDQLEFDESSNDSHSGGNMSTILDDNSLNLNDSITKVKEVANMEPNHSKHVS